MSIALSLLLLHSAARADPTTQMRRTLITSAPHDVQNFIRRRTDCNHFDGEISGEPDLDERVLRIRSKLRCDQLDADTRRLEAKYRRRPSLILLMKETRWLMPR